VLGPTAARTLERLVGEVRKLPTDVHPMVQEAGASRKCFRSMAEHMRVLETEGTVIAADVATANDSHRRHLKRQQPARSDRRTSRLCSGSASARHVVARHSTHWVQFDEPALIVDAVKELVDGAK
jgi:hypothetical protein